MNRRFAAAALVAASVVSSFHAPLAAEEPREPLETRALRAIAAADTAALAALRAEVAALDSTARGALRVRVREDEVELRLEGEHPGDTLIVSMLEYLVCGNDYESLFVCAAPELARARRLGEALVALRRAAVPHQLRASLAWVEDGRARIESLDDIIRLAPVEKRRVFLDELAVAEYGLYAGNTPADPILLPRRARIPATLVLSIRLR